MTHPSPTIVACVDGSSYTDSVCQHAAWASDRLQRPIRVLHVHAPLTTYDGPTDYSGAIGVGEVGSLLEKLTEVDAARGKLDQQRGDVIVDYAIDILTTSGHAPVDVLHRRGSLVETLGELEGSTELVVLGKRGEHADFARLHLGSNLERVVRTVHMPVLVSSHAFAPIDRFAIAYDGGPSSIKAIEYVIKEPLLDRLACHLLTVGPNDQETSDLLVAPTTRL